MGFKATPLEKKLRHLDRELSDIKKRQQLAAQSLTDKATTGAEVADAPEPRHQLKDDEWVRFQPRPSQRRARRQQRIKALVMLAIVIVMFALVAYRMMRL